METNNTTHQPLPQNTPSNSNRFLIRLLSTLLLVSVFIASFFAYQTQTLSKELAKLKVNPEPVVTVTPSNRPAVNFFDYTKDWTEYRNNEYNFNLRYPSDFLKTIAKDNLTVLSVGNNDYRLTVNVDNTSDEYVKDIADIKKLFNENSPIVDVKTTNPYTAYLRSTQTAGGEFSFYRRMIIPNGSAIIDIYLSPRDPESHRQTEDLADYILSTLEWPYACTTDVKMCPDGSYVDRLGQPNCEFAACPTTTP